MTIQKVEIAPPCVPKDAIKLQSYDTDSKESQATASYPAVTQNGDNFIVALLSGYVKCALAFLERGEGTGGTTIAYFSLEFRICSR